jgi:putative inorganic carbon (hco3(-)) transporter
VVKAQSESNPSSISPARRLAKRLQNIQFWVVSAAAFSSIISEHFLPFAVLIGLAGVLLRLIAEGHLSLPDRVDWPILILGLMMPVTLLVTSNRATTLVQVYRLIISIMLFYEIVNWTITLPRLRLLIIGLCGLGLALSVSAIFSLSDVPDKFQFLPNALLKNISSLALTRMHPNVLGGSLAILLVGIAAGSLFSWGQLGRIQKGLLIFLCLIGGSVLVITQSRGGIMGTGAAFAVLLMLRFRSGKWLVLAATIILIGVIAYIGPYRALDEISQNTGTANNLSGRIEIWSQAAYMIEDFPLTGIGMGTFTETAVALYPFFLQDPDSVTHAHNLFLQVAVDLGIPGVIAWLTIWTLIVFSARQIYRSGRKFHIEWQIALGSAILCSQVAMGVHGIWDAVTWGTRPAIVAWIIWGIAIAGKRLCKGVQDAKTE